MSIVDNLDLEKLVARAVVAGGLGLAVMGLGAGMANAEPGPRGPACPQSPSSAPSCQPAPSAVPYTPGQASPKPPLYDAPD